MAADGRADGDVFRVEAGAVMRYMRRLLARVRSVARGHDRADADLQAEMQSHLELSIAENIRRGMEPSEARRQALIEAGGFTQATESVREQRGLPWLEDIAADLRFAVRHFRRTPLSTTTMVLVLSLGLGTNVVLLTVLNSIATMPAPGIARDAALVHIRGTVQAGSGSERIARLMSWPEVQQYAQRTDLFSEVAAYADEAGTVSIGNATTQFTADLIFTTSNYFSTLNVQASVGRAPVSDSDDDMRMTTAPTAMISDAMWKQSFGGTADVIGRTMRVNDVPVEIVGVAPPRFLGIASNNAMTIWVPLAAYPTIQKRSTAAFISYDSMFLGAAARLRAGVSAKSATPVVAGLAGRAFDLGREGAALFVTAAPGEKLSGSADVVPLLASNTRISQRSDMVRSGAAASGFALLALLITCTNVSALMVGLAVARRREISVRLSLGAPRRRLIRQLLTESILLALIAAGVGLLVTAGGIQLIGSRLQDTQLVVDWRVTLATCSVAVVTGILFGISPALHATRIPVGEVLRSSSSTVAAQRSRLQPALVVLQIALTQPLLVGLGLVVTTMVSDMGRSASSNVPDQIAEIELDTWANRVSDNERALRIAAAVERVGALPGVVAALPMQMGLMLAPLAVHPDDRVAGVSYDSVMQASLTAAPRGFFSSFDIPIVRGRDFDATEYAHTSNDGMVRAQYSAAVIGTDLARRLFGDANPVGRRLVMPVKDPGAPIVVVGVVDEPDGAAGDVNGPIRVYVPYSTMNTGVIVRTAGPALPLLGTLRTVVAAEAPQLPVARVQTMKQREQEARRNMLRTGSAFAGGGVLALLLSAIGLYAVVSFGVGQRTREIGIRTALGAQRGQVIGMFFGRGLILSAMGLVIGIPLSMLVTRLIASTLRLSSTSSPLVAMGIVLVVLVVASVAVWIPARRASTINPILAIRSE